MPPRHRGRLTASDAAFLYLEREASPMHSGGVGLLEGAIDFPAYRRRIEANLPGHPRLSERVVASPFLLGHPTWETDPHFDLDHHLRRHRLEEPGAQGELENCVDEIISERLDRSRPLWELHVIEGLAGGHSALVTKVHQVMVDGLDGMRLLRLALDLSPKSQPASPHGSIEPTEPLGAGGRLLETLWDNAEGAVDSLASYQRGLLEGLRATDPERVRSTMNVLRESFPDLVSPPKRLPFNRTCTGRRHLSWTSFSFAEARAVRAVFGGTVNDVLLALLAGAVGRYCEGRGEVMKGRTMRVLVPVTVRTPGEHGALGSRIAAQPVDVPLDVDNPAHRVALIRDTRRALKRSKVADSLSLLSDLAAAVPVPVQAAMGSVASNPYPVFNMVCQKMPGPQIPLYAEGLPLLAYYPYLPVGFEMGVGCAVFSYNQTLFVGLNSDVAACPDVEDLKSCYDRAIAEMKDAAGVDDIPHVDTVRRSPSKTAAV